MVDGMPDFLNQDKPEPPGFRKIGSAREISSGTVFAAPDQPAYPLPRVIPTLRARTRAEGQ